MSGSTGNNVWPLPKFYFRVTCIPGAPVSFQEVTGLDSAAEPIEYRAGGSPGFDKIRRPGLGKVGNVTMKKGIFVNEPAIWAWFNAIKMNTMSRAAVVKSLSNESGNPKITWTLNNAFRTKITGADMKSGGNEVAVESIEIAYETLTLNVE